MGDQLARRAAVELPHGIRSRTKTDLDTCQSGGIAPIARRAAFVSIGSETIGELQHYWDSLALDSASAEPLAASAWTPWIRHAHRPVRGHVERQHHRSLTTSQLRRGSDSRRDCN